jgi:hypothetical protein
MKAWLWKIGLQTEVSRRLKFSLIRCQICYDFFGIRLLPVITVGDLVDEKMSAGREVLWISCSIANHEGVEESTTPGYAFCQ